MTRDIDDTDREYAFQELPVRYVVKCSDDRVVPNPEEGSGVSRHRFYHAAADAARSRSRAEDLVFAVWDVEAGKFVTGPVTDVFSRDDFGCPVCGDEYDGRLEGELVTYDHKEANPDWNADDPLSGPMRTRTCEIPCEDDPWAPDNWEAYLEEQREIQAEVRESEANVEAHLRNRGY
ncbi:hypothetical protein ACFQJ5_14735 [Halomicroarcula sp. GCM10025324]|uniref:hypothetical protein n=1 Tax=Haloarcula TaxID=2237 RepID=UPI0023E78944|nr:hypothetical protein [Halomicroarcula sp. ZS-22-S1]